MANICSSMLTMISSYIPAILGWSNCTTNKNILSRPSIEKSSMWETLINRKREIKTVVTVIVSKVNRRRMQSSVTARAVSDSGRIEQC